MLVPACCRSSTASSRLSIRPTRREPWFREIGKGPELEEYARGTNEMGIALRPVGWDFNKPCYLCHGMMGY
ncbi:hypothetical protein V8F06_001581 [Rhypophila decipiens]